VVASITGLQPEAPELDATQFTATSPSWIYQAIGNIASLTQSYYPAYAAIVQVAAAPKGVQANGQPWSLEQYPYFADFEPKKREVIELATDTGEHVTQSRDALNVRKGSTSTDSLENVDIAHGFSAASAASMGAGGASASGSISGSESIDQGFRSIQESNVENVVTTDASREKRESFSHSASINQLYHLLDSYRLATNRALFFLNARPHMIQSPYTFVNGPRELEGIQEFFLIVKRPIAMKELCIRATLETAHLYAPPPQSTTRHEVPPLPRH
jgi:hypothetical protein